MAKKEVTYESICKEITDRQFSPVYVLMGDEPYFIDRITDLLIANVLQEEERDFNQTVFYGVSPLSLDNPDSRRNAS